MWIETDSERNKASNHFGWREWASWRVHDTVWYLNVFNASDCAHFCLHDFSLLIHREPDVCFIFRLFISSWIYIYIYEKQQPSDVPEDVWQFVKAASIFKTKYWTSMLGEISKHIHFCQAKPLWTEEVHCFYLPMINIWWGGKAFSFWMKTKWIFSELSVFGWVGWRVFINKG